MLMTIPLSPIRNQLDQAWPPDWATKGTLFAVAHWICPNPTGLVSPVLVDPSSHWKFEILPSPQCLPRS
jgi:hypothetical protein